MEPYETVLVIIAVVAALLALGFGLWLFLVAPRLCGKKMEKYKSLHYAHRGLHKEGVPENSLAAFSRACDAGFAIELDIRLSSDGELVVFHDETLLRTSGVDKKVSELTARELGEIRLFGTEEHIPTFCEVLSLVDGRVPLLVEIKQAAGEGSVAERFLTEIEGYRGDYIVESFNPMALRTVRRSRPDILTGILSSEFMKDEKFRGSILYRQLERLRTNFLARPDFISYDKDGWRVTALRLIRCIFRAPTLTWTVKSREEEEKAREYGFDGVIFEGYLPKK